MLRTARRRPQSAAESQRSAAASSNKRSQSLSLTDRQTNRQTRAPVYTDSGQHAFWKKRTQICCNRMNPGGLYLFSQQYMVAEFSGSSKFTCVLFLSSSSCGTRQVSCLCLCPRVLSSSSTLTRLSCSLQSQYKLFFFFVPAKTPVPPKMCSSQRTQLSWGMVQKLATSPDWALLTDDLGFSSMGEPRERGRNEEREGMK